LARHAVAELPESAALLLHPDRKVIRFFGRGWDLQELVRWRDDPEAAVVRLVTAPAGYGKTRLAAQFAAASTGWLCQRVANDTETRTASLIDESVRLLLVVDYADARDPAGLCALLAAAHRHRRAVRVLLLARSAGPWWPGLSRSYAEQAGLIDALTVPGNVKALDAAVDERPAQQVVDDAAGQFAQYLHKVAPGPIALRGYGPQTPLLRLHAEALLAVLGGPRTVDGRYDVVEEVLRHEARYWQAAARRAGLSASDRPEGAALLRRVAGVAAVVGAADRAQTEALVRVVPGLTAVDDDAAVRWADWLYGLYPAHDGDDPGDGAGRLGSVQPDLLAEYLAVQTMTGLSPQEKAQVFSRLTLPQAVTALTTLGRAHSHHSQEAEALIETALAADPPTMAEAALRLATQFPGLIAGRLLDLLATASFTPQQLRRLAERTPYPSLQLGQVALTLTTRIVQGPHLSGDDQAKWVVWHALRLAEVGRRDEALTASQRAVDLYRDLAAVDRDAHLSDLAMAVNNHGLRLREAGRRDEAFATAQEAVDLYRKLVTLNRDIHLPGMAKSVNNHVISLAEAGRLDEALIASQEAIRLRRELVVLDRDAYLPDLATSVNNHAIILAEAGHGVEAIAASREAVDLYRDLAGVNRDAHLPALAASMNNHAVRSGEAGRQNEALAAAQEALDLYRELVEANRNAHLPDLAMALNNHVVSLGEGGRREEALTATQEVVDLYRELAELNRDAYLADLAQSLLRHAAARVYFRDQLADARRSSEQAARLYQQLAEQEPAIFAAAYADARSTHAQVLVLMEPGEDGYV
jgi:tetratricopeptide (TPR) repeat protein